jgi:class 3 adenylate cyclase
MTATVVLGSVLFTDLVGFTEYNDCCGDEAALDVLERQRRLVDAVLTADPEARVVKEIGDGLMIWFAGSVDAVRLARDLRDTIVMAKADDDFPLAVRMGLHHGEALVRGDDLVGSTVNIAARVCDLAGPGVLLASEAVVSALEGCANGRAMAAVGPARVKGVSEPIWLHRVA